MYFKVIWILIFLFGYINFNSAQSCQGFYKSGRCTVKNSSDFKQYGQARSAAVEVGKTYKFDVVLYGNKDYIFVICSEIGFKNVHFKLFDKKKNEVIYDNEEDNYNSSIAFSMENTTNVEVEVEVLQDKDGEVDPVNYRVCMGVQILWRKIPKMGFD